MHMLFASHHGLDRQGHRAWRGAGRCVSSCAAKLEQVAQERLAQRQQRCWWLLCMRLLCMRLLCMRLLCTRLFLVDRVTQQVVRHGIAARADMLHVFSYWLRLGTERYCHARAPCPRLMLGRAMIFTRRVMDTLPHGCILPGPAHGCKRRVVVRAGGGGRLARCLEGALEMKPHVTDVCGHRCWGVQGPHAVQGCAQERAYVDGALGVADAQGAFDADEQEPRVVEIALDGMGVRGGDGDGEGVCRWQWEGGGGVQLVWPAQAEHEVIS